MVFGAKVFVRRTLFRLDIACFIPIAGFGVKETRRVLTVDVGSVRLLY